MNVMTSRFGALNVQESDILRLTEGLVGFRASTQFLLLADQQVEGLYWLQSLDTPELAFALVTPGEGLEDYHVDVRAGDRAALALDDCQEPEIFLILNRNEAGVLTVNLQGPMVFNLEKRLGRQMVLTSSRHSVRHPLGEPASDEILLSVGFAFAPLRASA
ncbi:MAG: flagellar assembly protein FliW [Planctomycetota bacterium]|nr:flagellar assembly protein FliW [Planctomycetota bacterium]